MDPDEFLEQHRRMHHQRRMELRISLLCFSLIALSLAVVLWRVGQ